MESTQPSAETVPVASLTPRTLPSPVAFITQSFRESWQRLDLLAWYLLYAAVGILLVPGIGGLLSFALFTLVPPPVGVVLGSITLLATMVGFIYILSRSIGALYYAVAHGPTVPFGDGWRWMSRRVWSLLWVGALFGAVAFTGLLFLIIPGLILMVYLCLYNLTFVKEERTGMAALQRSFDLVRGHWWGILGRGILLQLAFMVFYFGLVLVFVGLSVIAAEGAEPVLMGIQQLISFLFQLFSVLVTVTATRVLYDALAAGQDASTPVKGSGVVPVFAWLAIPLLIGVTVLAGLAIGAAMSQFSQPVEDAFTPAPMMEMDASFEDMTDEEFEAYIMEQFGSAMTEEELSQ